MDDKEPATHRPAANDMLTLAETSAWTGRDRKTLMNDIRDGRLPNAIQEPSGRRTWHLRVQDLVDAGIVRADQVAPPRPIPQTDALTPEQHRIVELETRVQVQDAITEELRVEITRQHELVLALVARLGSADPQPRRDR